MGWEKKTFTLSRKRWEIVGEFFHSTVCVCVCIMELKLNNSSARHLRGWVGCREQRQAPSSNPRLAAWWTGPSRALIISSVQCPGHWLDGRTLVCPGHTPSRNNSNMTSLFTLHLTIKLIRKLIQFILYI